MKLRWMTSTVGLVAVVHYRLVRFSSFCGVGLLILFGVNMTLGDPDNLQRIHVWQHVQNGRRCGHDDIMKRVNNRISHRDPAFSGLADHADLLQIIPILRGPII